MSGGGIKLAVGPVIGLTVVGNRVSWVSPRNGAPYVISGLEPGQRYGVRDADRIHVPDAVRALGFVQFERVAAVSNDGTLLIVGYRKSAPSVRAAYVYVGSTKELQRVPGLGLGLGGTETVEVLQEPNPDGSYWRVRA